MRGRYNKTKTTIRRATKTNTRYKEILDLQTLQEMRFVMLRRMATWNLVTDTHLLSNFLSRTCGKLIFPPYNSSQTS